MNLGREVSDLNNSLHRLGLFEISLGSIVLNASERDRQATAIVEHINYVIGMSLLRSKFDVDDINFRHNR